ncbi:alkaline phosphatase family protein [Pseudoalteromonas arctica]|uniref:Clostridium neurotoxin receptor binding N-terminal domain-containing protein n=1 Tax=Pseudoalteromonas arctica TaxID=394751 RepID=A0A7Y0HCV2_9GAMM|nr:alkaline phosphatase family protein [Pseudoalteromonas arctica]NMM41798.1 hypothetical protein [Pseudoalteromonas arctica]
MNIRTAPFKLAVISLCSIATLSLLGCNDNNTAKYEEIAIETDEVIAIETDEVIAIETDEVIAIETDEVIAIETDEPVKKVLVLGIDGLMYDYVDDIDNSELNEPRLENFSRLTISKAFNGGYLGSHSHQATYSGPSWSSILTGQWIDGHGVASNNNQATISASIFAHLYNEDNTIDMASYVAWSPINQGHIKNDMPYVKQQVVGSQRPENTSLDTFITTRLVGELTDPDSNLDFIFTHLDEIDGAGHACGWCEAYEQTLKETDVHLGRILDAIEDRELSFNENWLVMIVSDHGHVKKGGHGGDSVVERTSLIGTNKPELMNELFANNDTQLNLADEEQNALMGYPGITAITPTTLSFLGYQIKPEQQFSSPSLIGKVGVKNTFIQIKQHRSDEAMITLNWRVAKEVETVTLYRDDVKIAQVAASDQFYDDLVSIDTVGKGTKRIVYKVVPDTGNGLTSIANFSLGEYVPISSILKKALLHASFDAVVTPFDYIAGNEPLATFDSGPFNTGQAININRQNGYLSAPIPLESNLQGSFGFWLKVNGNISSDPNIISNKNWQSGFNPGFTLSATNNTMKFNIGDGSGRADVTLPYVHNQWMYVIVAYDLVIGEIRLYINDETFGFQMAQVAAPNVKSIASEFPVNIGEGGEGNYNLLNTKLDISVADLLFFNHALVASEARSLATLQQRVIL